MSHTNIEDLFELNRLPRGWQLVPLCIYFPIGLLLCVIRIFISLNALLAASILPRMSVLRSCVLRTMCLVLGLMVNEENPEEKNRDAKIVVSNHVSILDHVALDLVLPCIMPSMWDLPQIINWCLGNKDFSASQGRNILVQNVKKHLQECNCSILIHPEGATTNGTVGLLKFASWPFTLEQPIHPVMLKVSRPPPFVIATAVIGSHWWSDIFWFFFTPITLFTLHYLPEMKKDEEESEEEFAHRVQQVMAGETKMKATNYSAADVFEYIKKTLRVPPRPRNVPRQSVHHMTYAEEDVELNRMSLQVKEVLPYVPVDVIKRDIIRTRNVDLTITNLLEGLVPFIPESSSELSSLATSTTVLQNSGVPVTRTEDEAVVRTVVSQPCSSNSERSNNTNVSAQSSNFSMAGSPFGKTANERMQSFEERKQQLLEHARRLYIEKHNLN